MGTLALLCLGLLVALVVLRSLRRIAPDSVLVFFTDAARTKISRWQQGGLAFAWPWQATGRLELTAVSLEIAVDAPPLCLTEGVPLRFVVAVEATPALLERACLRLLDKEPAVIAGTARAAIIRHFEGLQASTVRVDRVHFEGMLLENIRRSLHDMGLVLISANLDGLFGDAPEVRYCTDEDRGA